MMTDPSSATSWAVFTAVFAYWAYDGHKSVDAAIGVIAVGATVFAGLPFWLHAHRALRGK